MATKKTAKKKKSTARRKAQPRKKAAARKKTAPRKLALKKKAAKRKARRVRGRQEEVNPVTIRGRRGLGAASGGQSGDTQGLSQRENVDSESVTELAEEGQDYEAEVVSGVENAKDPDQGEVRTHEVPEDDVPLEYTERDE